MAKTSANFFGLFQIAQNSAEVIADRNRISSRDLALTLGSGWGKAADLLGQTTEVIQAEKPRVLLLRGLRSFRHDSLSCDA